MYRLAASLAAAAVFCGSAAANDRYLPVPIFNWGQFGQASDGIRLPDSSLLVCGVSAAFPNQYDASVITVLDNMRNGGNDEAHTLFPTPKGTAQSAAVAFVGSPGRVTGTVISESNAIQTIVWNAKKDADGTTKWSWELVPSFEANSYVHGAGRVGDVSVLAGTLVTRSGARRGFFSHRTGDEEWQTSVVPSGRESQILGISRRRLDDDDDGDSIDTLWMHGAIKKIVWSRFVRREVWVPAVWPLTVTPDSATAAIAIPNLLDARKSGNESSAIATLRTSNPFVTGNDVPEVSLLTSSCCPDFDGDGRPDLVLAAGGMKVSTDFGGKPGIGHPKFSGVHFPGGSGTLSAPDRIDLGTRFGAVVGIISPRAQTGAFRAVGRGWDPDKKDPILAVWGDASGAFDHYRFGRFDQQYRFCGVVSGAKVEVTELNDEGSFEPTDVNGILNCGTILGHAKPSGDDNETRPCLFIPTGTFVPDSFAVSGDLAVSGNLSSVADAKDGQFLSITSRRFFSRSSRFSATFMSAAASYEFGEDPDDYGRPKEKANKTKCGSIFRSIGGGTGSGMMEFYDWTRRAYVVVGRTEIDADGEWTRLVGEATSKEGDFHNSLGQVLVRISGSTKGGSRRKRTDIDTVQTEIVALD